VQAMAVLLRLVVTETIILLLLLLLPVQETVMF
jgi:hypothetical protein